jgi:hypothetical protein
MVYYENLESIMKIAKLTAAALVASAMATASFAGTIEPMVEDTMVEEATGSSAASSGGGILLPLAALLLVGIVVAGDDS